TAMSPRTVSTTWTPAKTVKRTRHSIRTEVDSHPLRSDAATDPRFSRISSRTARIGRMNELIAAYTSTRVTGRSYPSTRSTVSSPRVQTVSHTSAILNSTAFADIAN